MNGQQNIKSNDVSITSGEALTEHSHMQLKQNTIKFLDDWLFSKVY